LDFDRNASNKQDYYNFSGLVGVDRIATNSTLGGNPTALISDRLWTFALPRKCWTCPNGYDGVNDTRFLRHRHTFSTVVTTKTSYFIDSEPAANPQPTESDTTSYYFNLDPMNPRNPFPDGSPLGAGCDIVLPICRTTNAWIGSGSAPSNVPDYTVSFMLVDSTPRICK